MQGGRECKRNKEIGRGFEEERGSKKEWKR